MSIVPLQKDKPAPTSRNYAKMRNRLRGLLKKKREVEEYFEYHPDTTPEQESQPQVKYCLESSYVLLLYFIICTGNNMIRQVDNWLLLASYCM